MSEQSHPTSNYLLSERQRGILIDAQNMLRHDGAFYLAGLVREVIDAVAVNEPPVSQVDWLGLALDLEAQSKRVDTQTAERAMLAGARGLRLMGSASPPEAERAWAYELFDSKEDCELYGTPIEVVIASTKGAAT